MEAYYEKLEALKAAQEYATSMHTRLVPKNGKTPVAPLAELICDHCGKPFVIEGGPFNRQAASAGVEAGGYVFVLGHATFLTEVNGTFRAYHGWIGSGCGGATQAADKAARAAFVTSVPKGLTTALRKAGLPDQAVYRALYAYDPGLGRNGPCGG